MATVGRIHPHLEARVVDAHTGRTLPRGQVGGCAGRLPSRPERLALCCRTVGAARPEHCRGSVRCPATIRCRSAGAVSVGGQHTAAAALFCHVLATRELWLRGYSAMLQHLPTQLAICRGALLLQVGQLWVQGYSARCCSTCQLQSLEPIAAAGWGAVCARLQRDVGVLGGPRSHRWSNRRGGCRAQRWGPAGEWSLSHEKTVCCCRPLACLGAALRLQPIVMPPPCLPGPLDAHR